MAAPIIFSAVYFLVAIKVLTSGVAGIGAGLYTGTTYLDAYGKTPVEVFRTMLTRPAFVLQTMFSPHKLEYLTDLFMPVLYALPFLSFSIVPSLPNLFLNLFASNTAMSVIPWHYNIILGGTLLAAAVFGIKRMVDRFGGAHKVQVSLVLAGAVAAFGLFGMRWWYLPAEYQPKPYDVTLRTVMQMVPRDATVICPTPLLVHFSDRHRINSAYSLLVTHKDADKVKDYEYIILDGNWQAYEAIGQAQLIQWYRQDPEFQKRYTVQFVENNVAVLRRVKEPT